MKQQAFEQQHAPVWKRLELVLEAMQRRNPKRAGDALYELPVLYRLACHHLSLAQARHYSPYLVQRLHDVVLRAHQLLYRSRTAWGWRIVEFLMSGFPRALRREWRVFLLSVLLFVLPAVILGVLTYAHEETIYSTMDARQVREYERMYSPDNHVFGRDREAASDLMMFGHYIQHNIGLGFQAFAGGLLFGIGALGSLLFNGAHLGTIGGYLTQRGFGDTFWSFVAGHGAFELTALCITAAAGLKLAHALFAPGRRTRIDAVRASALTSLPLVLGAALMLVAAAFIEAFWSSSASVSRDVKYMVAALLWGGVAFYFACMGRNRAA